MDHPRDGRFLGGDFFTGRIDRKPIVAIVNGGDHVTGVNVSVVSYRNVGEITGHLGGQRRVVGLHIGVIGRNREPADRQTVIARTIPQPMTASDG